jgi:tRNA-specific 2-thiouridylase
LNIDAGSNAITVGGKEDLASEEFLIRETHWISGKAPTGTINALVKLRYRHAGVPCELKDLGDGMTRARFVNDWSAVSPGQAAVFYGSKAESDGSRQIFGGGIICKETNGQQI